MLIFYSHKTLDVTARVFLCILYRVPLLSKGIPCLLLFISGFAKM